MARTSWLDETTQQPIIEEKLAKLKHFTDSMADGVIDNDELATQQQALVSAMQATESVLSDEQHEKVTELLVELTAFNIMKLLNEMAVSRLSQKFN